MSDEYGNLDEMDDEDLDKMISAAMGNARQKLLPAIPAELQDIFITLSEQQRKVMAVLLMPDTITKSLKDIARLASVSPTTVYRMRTEKRTLFDGVRKLAIQNYLSESTEQVMSALVESASNADGRNNRDRVLYLELSGLKKDGSGGIEINNIFNFNEGMGSDEVKRAIDRLIDLRPAHIFNPSDVIEVEAQEIE